MAFLTSDRQVNPSSITSVDSSALVPVLTTQKDSAGNTYVYLKGVASTAAGSVVTFDELGVTALLAANAVGPVAIAQAATVASTYGWYLVFGSSVAKTAGDVADNGNLYATATAGSVDDAVVAGDRVKNAWFRASGTGATTVLTQVNYPFVDDIAD